MNHFSASNEDISSSSILKESPLLTPDTPVNFDKYYLSKNQQEDLRKFVTENADLYELSLFASGEVIPSESVLKGIRDDKDNDKNPKITYKTDTSAWITPQALAMYLAWEQCWWYRDKKGEQIPIRAVDLYKLVYHEYCNIDKTGEIRYKSVKKEEQWMKKRSNKCANDVSTEEQKDPKQDQDFVSSKVHFKEETNKYDGEDGEIDFEDLGLPEINKNCRERPFTLEELEQRAEEYKRKNKFDSPWFGKKDFYHNMSENKDTSFDSVPSGAKLSFTMKFREFINVLKEFERDGYLTLRPMKQIFSPFDYDGTPDDSKKREWNPYPKHHLSVYFSSDKGFQMWQALNGNTSSSLPPVILKYHKQRFNRIVYYSEVELFDGPIYESIKAQKGNPHDLPNTRRKRVKIK